jgi:hypothetical protein
MSPKERRAYRLGFLRAMRQARKDLHAMAAKWMMRLPGSQTYCAGHVQRVPSAQSYQHAIDVEARPTLQF